MCAVVSIASHLHLKARAQHIIFVCILALLASTMEARQPTADSQHIIMEIGECAGTLAISPDNPSTIQVGNSLINSICCKIGALPQLPHAM